MKLLCLVTDAYGGRGGIAQSCRDVIDALAARPEVVDIRVIPRAGAADADRTPSKVRQDPARPGRVTFALAALRAAAEKPNVIFCNHLYMAPLAALVARLAGAKLIVQLHGIEIWTPPTRLQRWALESADALWCVSRDTRTRVLSFCGIAPERAIVVNNCVRPQFSPGDQITARAHWGVGKERVLLSVGRLDPRERYKGHDRVIAALPHLRCDPPVKYLIAGEGADQARLEELTRVHHVADRVRFLGTVDDDRLPDLYRAADLFVLPSTGEGFGIVFLEAMASGVPALGLNVGGSTDALADGELGYCIGEHEFVAALECALKKVRPCPSALHDAVERRFGTKTYNARVHQALSLIPAPGSR